MQLTLQVPIRRLDPDLPLPAYARPGDAGLDLHAAVGAEIAPGGRVSIPTGIAVEIPNGWVGLVHPRSGLAARHGVTVLNAPGTVDAGYRGEVKVTLLNTDRDATFVVQRGDRIAQLLLQEVAHVALVEVDVLSDTVRGDTGHGDSGGFGVQHS
ncbi:MAG: dUTP diphosphatase [Mobilicoccus sp.]|nr:dUTP diphosphatase [Mobilicoccus sp.]